MRLYQLFYVTALIAASVNLFGAFGVVVGFSVAAAWYYVYSGKDPKRSRRALEVLVVAAIILLFPCCLLPAISNPRYVARRFQCSHCVKSIALAMLNYESAWKKLPPAITYDATGRPMHSWRVLLLPYLEEQRLYDKYSFNEPWDGPNNSKLLNQMPTVYRCPYLKDLSANDFTSSYRVLVGERTCFPPNGSRVFDAIRDSWSSTLLVVESSQPVPWMSPSEPTVDEFFAESKDWLPGKSPHRHSDLLTHYDSSGCYAMADGSYHYFDIPLNRLSLEKLAFVDDGAFTEEQLDSLRNYGEVARVRWEGYLAIFAFLFFAILPAFWLFRKAEVETTA